jgi:hypothetical protein
LRVTSRGLGDVYKRQYIGVAIKTLSINVPISKN